jgi:hypothetical protein
MAHLTLGDLLVYAASQARIESRNYFDPRYPRRDEIRAWQNDKGHRDRDRRKVFRTYAGRIKSNERLIPGAYGGARRLVITADGIDYTACQYAAREIWPAVFDYFERTNTPGGAS